MPAEVCSIGQRRRADGLVCAGQRQGVGLPRPGTRGDMAEEGEGQVSLPTTEKIKKTHLFSHDGQNLDLMETFKNFPKIKKAHLAHRFRLAVSCGSTIHQPKIACRNLKTVKKQANFEIRPPQK